MTGPRLLPRCAPWLLLLASLAAGQEPPPPADPLEALMTRLRAMPGLRARFREEKQLALLEAPLVNEGTIHFAPPDLLARHTTSPVRQSVVIDGTRVRVGDARRQQELDLSGQRVGRLLLEGFLRVLAGDRAGLEEAYALELTGELESGWTLTLRPKDPGLARVLERIEMAGEDARVSRLRVVEASGDETVTTFSEVDVDHRYDEAERAAVFRLPAPGEEGR